MVWFSVVLERTGPTGLGVLVLSGEEPKGSDILLTEGKVLVGLE